MRSYQMHPWHFFPIVGSGVFILLLVILLRSGPERLPQSEPSKPVETTQLQPVPTRVSVSAFGRAQPQVRWQLLPQVGGTIVYKHPDLAVGKMLAADTLLLKIDPLDYQIRLAQARADRQALEGQLAGKQLQQQNLTLSLAIEKRQLEITQLEYDRKATLKKKNLVSQSELDAQRQKLLSQQRQVQELQNSLTLLPNETDILEAQLLQVKAREEEAATELAKTEIRLPFEGRVSEVNVELNQLVSPQQQIARINGTEVMEVEAKLTVGELFSLIQSVDWPPQDTGSDEPPLPGAERLGLEAEVILRGGDYEFHWPARVTRINETVDPVLATVGVVLQIEQNYRDLTPAKRPPLVNGMFVSATIKGAERRHWLVPERAVHQDKLYLMDADKRLRLLPIRVLFRQDGMAAVTGALETGMQLVLTDLNPAVPGILLQAINGQPTERGTNSHEQALSETADPEGVQP